LSTHNTSLLLVAVSLCKSIRVMHSPCSSLDFLHTSRALNSDQLWPRRAAPSAHSANIICSSSSLCIRFSFQEQYHEGCEEGVSSAHILYSQHSGETRNKKARACANCSFGLASGGAKLISLAVELFGLQSKLQTLYMEFRSALV
jgi:hypothetical protein